MRILGIDPGTQHLGVGVIDSEDNGDNIVCVHSEVLSPPKRDPIYQRLHKLHAGLVEVIEKWKPDSVAMEQPFASKNIRSALAIGQAQAAAMIAASAAGLDVATYAPAQVKSAVTDHGGSSKEQVQEMVRILLRLPAEPIESDAADALAVALCHVNAYRAEMLESRSRQW
ncbi:MAG: crossover junction endodeoxyribonuclease RuvC [Chloroflexi bacterium]|nr:crossover junction endodeoxyribonuclease RuvC [Chloroflexota bacterium]